MLKFWDGNITFISLVFRYFYWTCVLGIACLALIKIEEKLHRYFTVICSAATRIYEGFEHHFLEYD